MKNKFSRILRVVVPAGPQLPPFLIDFSGLSELFSDAWNDPEHFAQVILESDMLSNFKFFLAFFSALFLMGIVTLFPKVIEAERERRARWKQVSRPKAVFYPARWEVVMAHLKSTHSAEWKLAVLEADNILGEILKRIGCPGDTVGEMLKSIKRRDLKSLNDAWEAHKVRNAIAHEGSRYELSEREAKRVIGMYEAVFRELDYL